MSAILARSRHSVSTMLLLPQNPALSQVMNKVLPACRDAEQRFADCLFVSPHNLAVCFSGYFVSLLFFPAS